MNILICGGLKEANYVVNAFKASHNHLVIINENEKIAKSISELNHIDVINSDPTKRFSFEVADVFQESNLHCL